MTPITVIITGQNTHPNISVITDIRRLDEYLFVVANLS